MDNLVEKLDPIFVVDLFPKLNGKLINLLKSLEPQEWQNPTICPLWTVKDIVSHLLDTNLRKISIYRDNYFCESGQNINSYQDLVAYLNQLNADWVKATSRISPKILIDLLDQATKEVYLVLKALDPFQPSIFSVAWAGEETSDNWFDIAREYTEHWHHQQQIRLATNRVEQDRIDTRELYFPVLDAFMRALPYTYRNTNTEENTLLKFNITGKSGGSWFLLRQNNNWQLVKELSLAITTEVNIDQNIAWRLFTKGIDRQLALKDISIIGDKELAQPVINMLSVMA